jgi:hypothetical protein
MDRTDILPAYAAQIIRHVDMRRLLFVFIHVLPGCTYDDYQSQHDHNSA